MELTSNNILRIQEFLIEKGFIQSVASGHWDNDNKISGYATYLESLGVSYPENRELPRNVQMLPAELRDFVTIPDSVKIGGTDEDEDSELGDDSDDEDSELDDKEFIDLEDQNFDFDDEFDEDEDSDLNDISNGVGVSFESILNVPESNESEELEIENLIETPVELKITETGQEIEETFEEKSDDLSNTETIVINDSNGKEDESDNDESFAIKA